MLPNSHFINIGEPFQDKFEDIKQEQSTSDQNETINESEKGKFRVNLIICVATKVTEGNDSYIQVKTGTSCLMMKNPPHHIKDAEEFEPLYTPKESILEDCLRREAERVAHQENLMNRVVYDAIDSSPYSGDTEAAEGELVPFYQPQSEDEYT